MADKASPSIAKNFVLKIVVSHNIWESNNNNNNKNLILLDEVDYMNHSMLFRLLKDKILRFIKQHTVFGREK